MHASTELFLWNIVSLAESLFDHSLIHANDSFEGWACRRGMLRQIQRLERDAYLERLPGGKKDRIYRITPKGKLAAIGGIDPEERWGRPWDGQWRLFLFDLPRSEFRARKEIHQGLRRHGLGCLQGSVWLSPDPLDQIASEIKGGLRHTESLLLFEGRQAGGERDKELVGSAWNFDRIAETWDAYRHLLREGEEGFNRTGMGPEQMREWCKREHASWMDVVEKDPFLPGSLLPRDYPGRDAWKERKQVWAKLAASARSKLFR